MFGALGAGTLIDVESDLAGDTTSGVAGNAPGDTAIGALLVDEEGAKGTDTRQSLTVIVLSI